MKPLRIAFITPFYPLKGGIARFSGLFKNALRARGYDVVPVAFQALYPEFISKGAVDGAKILDAVYSAEIPLVLYNPFSWFQAIRYIKLMKPDILLAAYWTGLLAPLYYMMRRLTGIKMVVLLHNFSSHESFFFDPFMRRLLATFAAGFLTLSNAVSQEVKAAVPETHVLPLFHPTYEPEKEIPSRRYARRELNLDEGCPVLLFFGYVRAYKGLDIILRSMPAILQKEPSLRLVVAGQFIDDHYITERLIQQLGIGSSVDIYPGYVSSERSALLFGAADAVVLPYRHATQSGVVQLSYGYKLPVIVTPAGALPEMVRHGETGWIARDCTPEAFATAVGEFLETRKDLTAVRSAIETFRKDYSWEDFAAAAGSFLEQESFRR